MHESYKLIETFLIFEISENKGLRIFLSIARVYLFLFLLTNFLPVFGYTHGQILETMICAFSNEVR